jgi:hypothetical protein
MTTTSNKRHGRLVIWLLILVVALALGAVAGGAQGTARAVPEIYPTIQDAIDHSAVGDTVLLSPGTYRGVGNRDIELRGRDLVIISREGPEVTTIDCEFLGRGILLQHSESRATRIEGITIRNGFASGVYPDTPMGGGINCLVASPTIVGCRISDCWADYGGGVYLGFGAVLLDRCVISGNSANLYGAGIAAEFGNPEITNCLITGNWGLNGGGVAFPGAGPSRRLTGCTITGNLASYGGGVQSYWTVELDRCIVWDNSAFLEWDELDVGLAEIRCSDVDSTGVHPDGVVYDPDCLFTNPMFCNPSASDWTLHADSPCLPEHSPCGELIGALGVGCGLPTPTGACCFTDTTCQVLTQTECEGQGAHYLGDAVPCEPNPCMPVPTERVSWGQIKARYGVR